MNTDTVILATELLATHDPFSIILDLCRDKTVLNVGAAGGVHGYLPGNEKVWLHYRLRSVAKKLIGVDIDVDGIDYAKSHGYDILHADCEHANLGEQFDVIVMSDVIEHLNAPFQALKNLAEQLAPNGIIVITTPNASAGNIFLRALLRRKINIYWDHVCIYMPEHIQVLAGRAGLRPTAVYFFDHVDKRSLGLWIKSLLSKFLALISPRLASSFLVILQAKV